MINKLRTSLKILAIVSIFLLFYTSISSQMPFERGAGKPGGRIGFPEGVVTGEVVEIDDKNIVVLTHDGDKKEMAITPQTSFIKELRVEKSQLRKGDNLLVIEQPGGDPIMIKILMPTQFRPQGFEGREAKLQGPVIGVITELEPLTVELSSGETKIIKIVETTRLLKEIPVEPSEIKKGINVRVIAPPRPGRESREALKVIFVLPEERPSFRKESSLATLTLPDLPQQSKDSAFIYGIWLGRGLYSNEELDRAFRVVSNLGLKYFKVEFKWDYVEPQKDRWQWNNEDTLDVEHIIKLAKQYNLSIIPYFDIFMPWGEKRHLNPEKGGCETLQSKRGQYQSPDPGEYAEYVFTVVDKLRKSGVDVRYIELDNEDSNMNDGYRSWSCFINVTAKKLKEAENAAYDKVKEVYPDVMISSTTFLFPGMSMAAGRDIVEKDIKRRNSFIKVYFGEEPKPKFDFLGIHEVLGGSGNPYTTRYKPRNADYEYNFGSYHDAYDMWREILDRYGYKDKPIFNLESELGLAGDQDAEILQRVIFARTNAGKNKVTGWILSELTLSEKFVRLGQKGFSKGIAGLTEGYELKEGYYGFYTLMTTLARYTKYEGRMTGELNSLKPWVEKFSDGNGNILYIAFIPYKFDSHKTETIDLKIGPNKEAKITRSDTKTSTVRSQTNDYITLGVDHRPLFIEVKK